MNTYANSLNQSTINNDHCYDNAAMDDVKIQESNTIGINMNQMNENNQKTSYKVVPLIHNSKFKNALVTLFNTVIFIAVIAITLLVESGVIPQKKLAFVCGDQSISYPYRGDTIGILNLVLSCFLGPLLVILLVELLRERCLKRINRSTVWSLYQRCHIGTAFTLLIIEMMKITLGEHRPHFIDTCQPSGYLNCTRGSLIVNYNCTNTSIRRFLVTDSFRSFPSGHAALSLFIAIYCSYVIQSRIPSERVTKTVKPLLITLCFLWSMVCSFTRITDRRHHWWDVLGGATVGLSAALSMLYFAPNIDYLNMHNVDMKNHHMENAII